MNPMKITVEKSAEVIENLAAVHGTKIAHLSVLFLDLQNSARIAFTVWASIAKKDEFQELESAYLRHKDNLSMLFYAALEGELGEDKAVEVYKSLIKRVADNEIAFNSTLPDKNV